MAKVSEIKVPVLINGKIKYEVRKGYVANLKVANVIHRCFLQFGHDNKPAILADYASGYRIGDLTPIKITRTMSWGTNAPPMGDREAAQLLLDSLVATYGHETVLRGLRSKLEINK